MAIAHRARSGDGVGGLKHQQESLWADAGRRVVRNRAAVIGMSIIVILVLTAILAPQIAPQGFADQAREEHDLVPEWATKLFPTMAGYAKISDKYLLGADYAGRDLFSRIVYGTRISLAVAFVGPLISLLIGVPYGSISGFFGGQVDELMMCFGCDVHFPGLLLIILL